jgi:hypothetical protein
MPYQAYKFDTETGPMGTVSVSIPVPPGTHVEVLVVVPQSDDFQELVTAAESSTDFWQNPQDDQDWNNA